MTDLEEILAAWERSARRGEPAVLATVVQVAGSAYRRPGARMLFPSSGEPVGIVSGGCLEGDLAERAREVLASGDSRTVVYDMRSPDDIVWGLGLGCNGEIRVLLERLEPDRPPQWLSFVGERLERRVPSAVATLFEGGAGPGARVVRDAAGSVEGQAGEAGLQSAIEDDLAEALRRHGSRTVHHDADGRASALIEFVAPPVYLLVFGAGADARPVVRGARGLGWRVCVLDNREAYATAHRFHQATSVRLVDFDRLDVEGLGIDSRTAILVMTHHFLHDLSVMRALLPTEAPYLGFLGPRKRTANLLDELEKEGAAGSPGQLQRLHGPVGLDIGSETPEEIALSALAEIQAVLAGRKAGFLRDRGGPLHDWDS